MADETVTWEHTGEFDQALEDWVKRAETAMTTGLQHAGASVVTEAHASFDTGHGPTSRSGTLAGSIVTSSVTKLGDGYEAQVGPSGVVYARRVELVHNKEHAYLQPGFSRAKGGIDGIFRDAWLQTQKG